MRRRAIGRRVDGMRKRSRGSRVPWTGMVVAAALLVLPSCILIVSTAPTTVSGATVVFVAVDDDGFFVPSLGVTVVDVHGNWREHGVTTRDGSFTCSIEPGISRVRADVPARRLRPVRLEKVAARSRSPRRRQHARRDSCEIARLTHPAPIRMRSPTSGQP